MITKKDSGFTVVELMVVSGIILCLAAVSVPALQRSYAAAQATRCSANLRVLGQATLLYAAENGMLLPATMHQAPDGSQSWTNVLQPYASGPVTFKCPVDENRGRERTYVMNDFLTKNPHPAPFLDYSSLLKISRQMDTILYVEAAKSTGVPSDHFHFSEYFQTEMPAADFAQWVGVKRHSDRANYLFVDGHVETLSWTHVQARLAQFSDRFIDPTR
jgi:prepilin-type processing-associated H-X9-DG protein